MKTNIGSLCPILFLMGDDCHIYSQANPAMEQPVATQSVNTNKLIN